jgi:hypothetical protein
MRANASIGPPALTLGAGVPLTGSPLNARRQPIPHSARGAFGCSISRGFVPWRLSDAGPGACGEALGGRHPKPITQNPSHKPPLALQKRLGQGQTYSPDRDRRISKVARATAPDIAATKTCYFSQASHLSAYGTKLLRVQRMEPQFLMPRPRNEVSAGEYPSRPVVREIGSASGFEVAGCREDRRPIA